MTIDLSCKAWLSLRLAGKNLLEAGRMESFISKVSSERCVLFNDIFYITTSNPHKKMLFPRTARLNERFSSFFLQQFSCYFASACTCMRNSCNLFLLEEEMLLKEALQKVSESITQEID